MKHTNYLPMLSLLLGSLCQYLRRLLYLNASDAAGLLQTGTPLEWGLYGLTALSLLLFAAAAWKPVDMEPFFSPMPAIAVVGQLAGGLGIGWCVLRSPSQMSGVLGFVWKVFGIAAAAGLLWAAWCTMRGKKPAFPALLAPCLFWMVHMVDNYRGWSGQPQLQLYLFDLLAVMAMTLFSYYTAAECLALGKPRMQTFTALAAGFSCIAAALPGTTQTTQVLYLLCALWALTSLYGPGTIPKKAE